MKTTKKYSVLGNKKLNGFTIEATLGKYFDTLEEAQQMLKIYNDMATKAQEILKMYNDMAVEAPKQIATFTSQIVIVISNETNGEIIEIQELPKKERA